MECNKRYEIEKKEELKLAHNKKSTHDFFTGTF